jgi:DNA polymerase III delta subunit
MVAIADIFQTINKINKDIPSLIIIDEFQDISLIDEAKALFPNAFQQISDLPIIVLGSKRHLLKNIFGLPASPLANWGKDVNIKPINYEEYHQYIEERFKQKGLEISLDANKYIQNEMQRAPESINMLCYEIYQNYKISQ